MLGGGRGVGGGAGGDSVLRIVGTAVTWAGAGSTFQEPIFSSSRATSPAAAAASRPTHKPNPSNNLSISSSGSSPFYPFSVPLPATASSGVPTCWPSFGAESGSCCDEFEWVSVDESEDERAFGFVDDFVF